MKKKFSIKERSIETLLKEPPRIMIKWGNIFVIVFLLSGFLLAFLVRFTDKIPIVVTGIHGDTITGGVRPSKAKELEFHRGERKALLDAADGKFRLSANPIDARQRDDTTTIIALKTSAPNAQGIHSALKINELYLIYYQKSVIDLLVLPSRRK